MFGMFSLSTKPFHCGVFAYVLKCVHNACICVGIISEEHKDLQQLHSCKKKEQEGVVLKLQTQLGNVCDELAQVRTTLRILEGADGYG